MTDDQIKELAEKIIISWIVPINKINEKEIFTAIESALRQARDETEKHWTDIVTEVREKVEKETWNEAIEKAAEVCFQEVHVPYGHIIGDKIRALKLNSKGEK